jgi:response regulator RpfG family c-di-GMP phosphodiesterase
MDGYEFASHVRNDDRVADVPIIMITSRVGDEHRARAVEIGVNDFLGKPCQDAQLLDAIRRQLEDDYTRNQEVDYQILEQDYQDALSATQALNVEIERASRQLSADLDQVVATESESLSHDETAALPVARMAELDLTLNQPAGNDDFPTLDDTELNDELTVDLDSGDQTIEMGVVSTKVDSRGS